MKLGCNSRRIQGLVQSCLSIMFEATTIKSQVPRTRTVRKNNEKQHTPSMQHVETKRQDSESAQLIMKYAEATTIKSQVPRTQPARTNNEKQQTPGVKQLEPHARTTRNNKCPACNMSRPLFMDSLVRVLRMGYNLRSCTSWKSHQRNQKSWRRP
jgi:hypothetical protein